MCEEIHTKGRSLPSKPLSLNKADTHIISQPNNPKKVVTHTKEKIKQTTLVFVLNIEKKKL